MQRVCNYSHPQGKQEIEALGSALPLTVASGLVTLSWASVSLLSKFRTQTQWPTLLRPALTCHPVSANRVQLWPWGCWRLPWVLLLC